MSPIIDPDVLQKGPSMARDPRVRDVTVLTTKRAVAAEFFAHGSPRIIISSSLLLITARFSLGQWSPRDLMMLILTLALTGTVEWVIHRYLLHAPEGSFRMRQLKTGTGHRQHHLDPNDIDNVLLEASDAFSFTVLLGVFSAAWSLPVLALLDQPLAAGFVAAWTLSVLALAHYEWTHLLIHTRYRPKSRLYSRLARNHRLHHYRNERYWLGVTSNSGDRLLRTLPDKSTVDHSETARSLV